MCVSLEEAMIRGDAFAGAELRQLFAHPILARLLEDLVLIGAGLIGYPAESGMVLRKHDGTPQPVAAEEVVVRIAHPHDLLQTGEWHLWQRDCFLAECTQPFKQVFRELYVLTEAEQVDGRLSWRYAGQQVNTKQASLLS